MKKVMFGLLVLVLSSLVVAQSSETSMDFYVGAPEVGQDYVPAASFWNVYGNYIIGLIIVLVIVIIVLKSRCSSVKKVKRKRRVKKVKRRK